MIKTKQTFGDVEIETIDYTQNEDLDVAQELFDYWDDVYGYGEFNMYQRESFLNQIKQLQKRA